jgi:hypothetical protein
VKTKIRAPQVVPGEWLPTVLRLRVDETSFAEFTREVREDRKPI